MRIAIETLGTRGDVQPYVALALALAARGHEVQLAGPEQYQGLAEGYGVQYVPLPAEFLAMMDSAAGKAAIAGSQGFGAGLKLLKVARPLMRRLFDIEWEAIRSFRAEAVVYHPKSLASPHIGEALGIPVALASPLPGFTPTSAFPSPILPFRSLGPLNKASHALMINAASYLFARMLAGWRETSLGLPAKPRRRLKPSATLYAYSPHVVPRPEEWGEDVSVAGYWFLDDPEWAMPADLEAFLAAGAPPVYVGFGSMPGLDPAATTALVTEALARTGKRGLLAGGGGALAPTTSSPHVHFISAAPHDRLLPRVWATVHHGGAGTTGASLRAGVPTAILPFFGDQPFWGRRVAELGVGPAPLDRRRLTVDSLAGALKAMDDPGMRSRAAAIGKAIGAEHGASAAARFVETRLGRPG